MMRKLPFRFTIVAVPKPFAGHIGVIQKNALRSWKLLPGLEQILLIGDETGTAAAAESIGAVHIEHVNRDGYGTPLLDDIFRIAYEEARTDWLLYVNSDILLTRRFIERSAMAARQGPGLVISRRWNASVSGEIKFRRNWERDILAATRTRPEMFSEWGIDVFVFPKNLFGSVPPFSLGRSWWDNWLVNAARRRCYPVIDVTEEATVIHQNHPYAGFASMEEVRRSQQGLRNFWLAGDSYFGISNIYDATHVLRDGEILPSPRATVSVVISHVGQVGELRACIKALSYQSYPRTYLEIIVVDNPESPARAIIQSEFPLVQFTSEARPGLAAMRNKGAAVANGYMIGFLDSTCRPDGDWIEKVVAAAQSANQRSIVVSTMRAGGATRVADDNGRADVGFTPGSNGHVPVDAFSATATLVPAEVWRTVGPFDEGASEDELSEWGWATRATKSGVVLIFSPDAIVSRAARAASAATTRI